MITDILMTMTTITVKRNRAFPSEVGTGLREGNTTKQQLRAVLRVK